MTKRNKPEKATPEQLVGLVFVMIVILVPLFVTIVYPSNTAVRVLFGHGRILLFWALIATLIVIYRDGINLNVRKIMSKHKRN